MSGNGNDSTGVGREWEKESQSRTPLPDTDNIVPLENITLINQNKKAK